MMILSKSFCDLESISLSLQGSPGAWNAAAVAGSRWARREGLREAPGAIFDDIFDESTLRHVVQVLRDRQRTALRQ